MCRDHANSDRIYHGCVCMCYNSINHMKQRQNCKHKKGQREQKKMRKKNHKLVHRSGKKNYDLYMFIVLLRIDWYWKRNETDVQTANYRVAFIFTVTVSLFINFFVIVAVDIVFVCFSPLLLPSTLLLMLSFICFSNCFNAFE